MDQCGMVSPSSHTFPFFAGLCVCWRRLGGHSSNPNRQSEPSMTLYVICFHPFPKRRHRKRHHSPDRVCCAFLINDAKKYLKRYLSVPSYSFSDSGQESTSSSLTPWSGKPGARASSFISFRGPHVLRCSSSSLSSNQISALAVQFL